MESTPESKKDDEKELCSSTVVVKQPEKCRKTLQKHDHHHQAALALIREQYLQARPPQQIELLKEILRKYVHGGAVSKRTTMDQVNLSKSAELPLFPPAHGHHHHSHDKMLKKHDEGLDKLGNKTKEKPTKQEVEKESDPNPLIFDNLEKEAASSSSIKQKTNLLPSSSSVVASAADADPVSNEEIALDTLEGLYGSSLGYSQLSPGAETSFKNIGTRGDYDVEQKIRKSKTDHHHLNYRHLQSFLHPPIQYRISFAKYIIKQLESRSVTQDGHEKDVEGPVEHVKHETLLETWYEGLEMLLSSCNEEQLKLEEPFYRLYEIKVNEEKSNKSDDGGGRSSRRRVEMVKIFENESSFVADGTTGLVTWKASTEFLNWFCSLPDEEEKSKSSFEKPEGSLSTIHIPFEKIGERTRWILELGCGCGLLAIAITKAIGPTLEQYLATDGSLPALEKAKLNVEENFWREEDKPLKSKIQLEKVEWNNEATNESFGQLVDGMTTIYGTDSGLLLGADIIFDPELVPDLVNLIQHFLESGAGNVIISSTIRNEATMQTFRSNLASMGLSTMQCASWECGEIIQIIT